MSNEHPDMHGNWVDYPLQCANCDSLLLEEDAYEIELDPVLLFCSPLCAEYFLTRELKALQDAVLPVVRLMLEDKIIVNHDAIATDEDHAEAERIYDALVRAAS